MPGKRTTRPSPGIKPVERNRTEGLGYEPTDEYMANNYWNSYEEKKWPSFSSLNDFFVKKGEDFPFCNFQEPWKNGDGKWTPRWEIFYEEGLYLKKKVTHIFSTKLFLKQKISVVEKEEEEDEEMIWDLFNVMALEDDISGDDYVNMIYATPRGKGK